MERPKKKFNEFKKEKNEQLSLFSFIAPSERGYSHSIEVWDSLPKYVLNSPSEGELKNGAVVRHFDMRGTQARLTIFPGKIKQSDEHDLWKNRFVGEAEELVEMALRKIMIDESSGVLMDNNVGIPFTIYQLKQELARNGHTYDSSQIKDALRAMATATLILETPNDEPIELTPKKYRSRRKNTRELIIHPIESLGFDGEDGETKTFVRFNELITKSIFENEYRLLNYETAMSFKSYIARQLYKRISHHFTQADLVKNNRYTVHLTTIIEYCGLQQPKRLKSTFENVAKALDEMKRRGVVWEYKTEKVLEKNKLSDVLISIFPSKQFIDDIVKANSQKKYRQERFQKEGKEPDELIFLRETKSSTDF